MPNRKKIQLELVDGILYDASTGDEVSKEVIETSKNTDFFVKNVEENLATGVAINQYRKTSTDFLSDLKDFKELSNIYKQIEISNKMFLLEDIVSTIVDIFIDLTITPFQIEGISEQAKPIFNVWRNNVNKDPEKYMPFGLDLLVRDMAYEWFISGNIFAWEVWNNVGILTHEDEIRPSSVPTILQLLNPRSIRVDRASFSVGDPRYILSPGLVNSDITLDDMISEIKLRDSNNPLFQNVNLQGGTMELPNTFLSHIKRRARHYDIWGIPYLMKVIQAVAYKQKLRLLDKETIEGLVNMITIFKIGSPNKDSIYHKVSPARLRAFSSLIKNPQASTMMVWPHDVDVITTGPDGKIMEFSDKYKDANNDIILGMGIPRVLLDGSGSASTAWIPVIALVERLETVRKKISNYLEHLMMKICIANDFQDCDPKIRWSPTNLRDERTIKNLLLAFYDRGLLPIQVMHEEGRYNHEEMIRLKEIEEDENLSELFYKPKLPFDSPEDNGTPNDGGDGRPTDTVKTQDESNVNARAIAEHIEKGIQSKFREDITRVINLLEDNIIDLNRRSKNQVELQTMAQMTRIGQITQVFATFDSEPFDSEIDAKFVKWTSDHIESLKKFIISNVMKVSRRKVDEEEKLVFIRGVFSEARRRSDMFVTEASRKIKIAKVITENKKDGKVGAIFRSNPNTKCQTCKDLDENFMTFSELFETVPLHPHSDFELEFVDDNPVLKGKSKNTPVPKNPKNKSKRL